MLSNWNTYTEIHTYKWYFKDYPHIKITDTRKIINTQTGRQLKRCVNGYSTGVWIGKKFVTNINKVVNKI